MTFRSKESIVCYLLLALLVVLLLVTAQEYPDDVRLVPFVIGIPTLFLFLVLVMGEFYPTLTRWTESTLETLWGGKTVESGDKDMAPWSSALRVIAWAVAFFILVFFLGLFLVPPVFVAAFLIIEAKVTPSKAITASIVASVCLYGGMRFLKIDIWTGAMPEMVPGWVGGSIIPPV